MTQQTIQYFKAVSAARDSVDAALMNATVDVPRSGNKVQVRDLAGFLRQGLFKYAQLAIDKESLTELDMLNEVMTEIEAAKTFFAHVEKDVAARIATLNPAPASTPSTDKPLSQRRILIKELTETINAHNGCNLNTAQVEHWVGSDTSIDTIRSYISDFTWQADQSVTPDDIMSLWEECCV